MMTIIQCTNAYIVQALFYLVHTEIPRVVETHPQLVGQTPNQNELHSLPPKSPRQPLHCRYCLGLRSSWLLSSAIPNPVAAFRQREPHLGAQNHQQGHTHVGIALPNSQSFWTEDADAYLKLGLSRSCSGSSNALPSGKPSCDGVAGGGVAGGAGVMQCRSEVCFTGAFSNRQVATLGVVATTSARM